MTGHDKITSVEVGAYTVPTDLPEADGTMAWDSTTMMLVELRATSGDAGARVHLLRQGGDDGGPRFG